MSVILAKKKCIHNSSDLLRSTSSRILMLCPALVTDADHCLSSPSDLRVQLKIEFGCSHVDQIAVASIDLAGRVNVIVTAEFAIDDSAAFVFLFNYPVCVPYGVTLLCEVHLHVFANGYSLKESGLC